MSTTPAAPQRFRISGAGRVLITVYAILAIGATSRAVYQLLTAYSSAPVPITLSAISGVIYLVATTALILRGPAWYRVAWITISTELVGVVLVGTLSLVAPAIFADDSSVWSYYGIGYVFIPLVLPVLGMLYLRRKHATVELGGAPHSERPSVG
ncbi:MAG TPA: hypothetical protein VIJ76_01680 [Galbitalea sp.]